MIARAVRQFAIVLMLAAPSAAVSISINFWDTSASAPEDNVIEPGETAGLIPVDGSYWNQFGLGHATTSVGVNAPLRDNQGNTTAATLDFVLSSCYVGFSGAVNGSVPESGQRDMMGSYVSWDADLGDVGDLEIKGLSGDFTTPGYDVYVYFETNVNNRIHTITLNGAAITGADASTWNSIFRDAEFHPDDSNVAIFRGLTAARSRRRCGPQGGRHPGHPGA